MSLYLSVSLSVMLTSQKTKKNKEMFSCCWLHFFDFFRISRRCWKVYLTLMQQQQSEIQPFLVAIYRFSDSNLCQAPALMYWWKGQNSWCQWVNVPFPLPGCQLTLVTSLKEDSVTEGNVSMVRSYPESFQNARQESPHLRSLQLLGWGLQAYPSQRPAGAMSPQYPARSQWGLKTYLELRTGGKSWGEGEVNSQIRLEATEGRMAGTFSAFFVAKGNAMIPGGNYSRLLLSEGNTVALWVNLTEIRCDGSAHQLGY